MFDQVTPRFEIEIRPREIFFFPLSSFPPGGPQCVLQPGGAAPPRFYMTLIHYVCHMTLAKTGNSTARGRGGGELLVFN